MGNIVPKAEGFVSNEVFQGVKKEMRDVLLPVMDGKLDVQDGIKMGMEALGAVQAVKGLPSAHRAKIIAAAVAEIASEITTDLVVRYPEEVEPEV